MVVCNNKTLKTVYCSVEKKNIYLVQTSVYLLNASGKNLCISAAVFVPEGEIISGSCVSQDGVDNLGDYLVLFDSYLSKNGSRATKTSVCWVLDPDYKPDFSVKDISPEKFKPLGSDSKILKSL